MFWHSFPRIFSNELLLRVRSQVLMVSKLAVHYLQ